MAETSEHFKRLKLPPLPDRFVWIWKVFIDIWRISERDVMGNIIITPGSVMDYCNCFHVPMTVNDKRLLFRMKSWALDEINKVNKKNKEV